MIMAFGSISVVSIVVAGVVAFLLGGLWFAVIFPRHYAAALGRPYPAKEKPAAIFVVGPLVCGLVIAATSAWLIQALKIESLDEALTFGAVVGFGYLGATTVNTGINPNIPHPLRYGLLSGGYFFTASLVVSVILAMMR